MSTNLGFFSPDLNEPVSAFRQSSHLNVQQRLHTAMQSYECDECGMAFTHISHFTWHKKIRTVQKPYKYQNIQAWQQLFGCNDCGNTCRRASKFMQHQKKHIGPKLYKHDACDKPFKFYSFLIRHQRVYTGEKPFQCDKCGKVLGNRQPWSDIKQFIFQENTLNVIDVEIPFTMFPLLNTGKLIPTQQYTNVINVKNALSFTHNLVNIRELILKRNPSNVIYGERSLAKKKSWDSIKNFTLERFSLSCVDMISAVTMILARMKELLLEKSHMDIANVTRNTPNLSWYKRTLSEVKPLFVISVKKLLKEGQTLFNIRKLIGNRIS